MNTSALREGREIVQRILVQGDLTLQTPAHFGNGEAEDSIDMPLLADPLEGRALLSGASLAGALRNYLWEYEQGYGVPYDPAQHRKALAVQLFGGARGDSDGLQSLLIVEDSLGPMPEIELRDGVRIDLATRTAADQAKFDMELLRAGTVFPLSFELLIPRGQGEALRRALAIALYGLQRSEIFLGARKRRGFGECSVRNWRICDYDLTSPHGRGLLAWLKGDTACQAQGHDIAALLGQDLAREPDRRRRFRMEAVFWLDGSLLIRSGFGKADTGPDVVHLHRPEAGSAQRTPIVPGTSLAGVIRQRASQIAQTMWGDRSKPWLDLLFGRGPVGRGDEHIGGRVAVRETVVENVRSLVQNRIKVDRFTGGVLDNFLFNEAPVFGGPGSLIRLDLTLRDPSPAEIGIMLLVLRDLWTADLPLGGGANVGRGRLRGVRAELSLNGFVSWTLAQTWQGRRPGNIQVTGDRSALEAYVAAFNTEGQA